ncbi:MAG: zinc ribbon domain-containing protein [Lachnospiraceae bacterium]|nr:zinc ribbon domain-containing protein [Lachnospiraceae bacterium]
MKICPTCGANIADDNAPFCSNCGYSFTGAPAYTAPAADPYDHTAEFDPRDISDNKVYSMIVYLMGVVGIIIAMLAAAKSPYTDFHVRQSLKLSICEILIGIAMLLLAWTIIVPIAGAIAFLVIMVIRVICFFQICNGQAKEPAIVRNLGFLK